MPVAVVVARRIGMMHLMILGAAFGVGANLCFALTGDAAGDYLDERQFANNGIQVEYHRYRHPVYRQLHGEFVPYLSVVDVLMNYGRESLKILVDQVSTCAEERDS